MFNLWSEYTALHNLSFKWSLHLQGWANTSQNMAVPQAATILVPRVSEKYIWRLKFEQKLPIGNQDIKKRKYRKNVKNLLILGWITSELFCIWHIHFICNYMIMKYEALSFHGCDSGKSSVQQLITYISQEMETWYVFISIFIPKVFDGIFYFRNALH